MVDSPVIEAARLAMGPVGAFLPVAPGDLVSAEVQRAAVRRLELAGFGTAWTNEVIGKDALLQLAVLLAATEHMVFGTCIANMWARPPQTTHAAATQLWQAYPGRFVLGLGVGYAQQAESVGREFGRPLATARSYLAQMGSPAPELSYPRLLAANGPKMLALAAEITDGALPAGGPPDFTASARAALGPEKLLVVYVDTSAAQGDATAVTATVRDHLAAGADHVIAGASFGSDFDLHVRRLEELAPALARVT